MPLVASENSVHLTRSQQRSTDGQSLNAQVKQLRAAKAEEVLKQTARKSSRLIAEREACNGNGSRWYRRVKVVLEPTGREIELAGSGHRVRNCYTRHFKRSRFSRAFFSF